MCPTDTTPDPRDMLRAPDEPEFRQPGRDDAAAAQAARKHETDADTEPAIEQRPPLPLEAQVRATDLAQDDENAAPAEEGPAERLKGDPELQRG